MRAVFSRKKRGVRVPRLGYGPEIGRGCVRHGLGVMFWPSNAFVSREICCRVPTEVPRRVTCGGGFVLDRFVSEAYGYAGTPGDDGVLRIDCRLALDAVTFTSASVHDIPRQLMGQSAGQSYRTQPVQNRGTGQPPTLDQGWHILFLSDPSRRILNSIPKLPDGYLPWSCPP